MSLNLTVEPGRPQNGVRMAVWGWVAVGVAEMVPVGKLCVLQTHNMGKRGQGQEHWPAEF